MMNIGNLTQQLAEKGINAEQIEVMKNGISCMGLRILTKGNISPVIYYSQKETLEDLIVRINDIMNSIPEVDIGVLSDREYVLDHLLISVQKRSDDDDAIVKRRILNVEGILRVDIACRRNDEHGTVRVTRQLLDIAGITEEEAWEAAMRNMVASFSIRSLGEAIGMFPSDDSMDPFAVCTTDNGMYGSAVLFFPEVFEVYCRRHNLQSCLILPSSTQEVLILEDTGRESMFSYMDLANMVYEVNCAEVDPVIQLDPVVYRYSLENSAIEIIAEV